MRERPAGRASTGGSPHPQMPGDTGRRTSQVARVVVAGLLVTLAAASTLRAVNIGRDVWQQRAAAQAEASWERRQVLIVSVASDAGTVTVGLQDPDAAWRELSVDIPAGHTVASPIDVLIDPENPGSAVLGDLPAPPVGGLAVTVGGLAIFAASTVCAGVNVFRRRRMAAAVQAGWRTSRLAGRAPLTAGLIGVAVWAAGHVISSSPAEVGRSVLGLRTTVTAAAGVFAVASLAFMLGAASSAWHRRNPHGHGWVRGLHRHIDEMVDEVTPPPPTSPPAAANVRSSQRPAARHAGERYGI